MRAYRAGALGISTRPLTGGSVIDPDVPILTRGPKHVSRSPRPSTPNGRPALRIVPREEATPAVLSLSPAWFGLGMATAIIFGAIARASFVLAADFPLNDGGMFYTMATDLQANGYQIPELTSYNFDAIPFAYPPLAFYAAAWLDAVTPLAMIDVFRILPLATSIALMGAFALLARRLLPGNVAVLSSVVAFAFIPFSYEWMIMGGGLTRSLGFLFAILALHEVHRLYVDRRMVCVLTTGLLGGLCALSHLEMLLFFSFSTALFFATYGRSWDAARSTAAAAAVSLVVSAPWWISVLALHGLDPFLAAISTGSPSAVNPVLTFIVFRPTDEPLFAIIAALGLFGAAWSMARGQWLIPTWVLACGILDPRGFGNIVSVPIALLAGTAVASVLLPLLTAGVETGQRRWILPGVVCGCLFVYALIGALVATPQLLTALEPDERDAMAWIAANTPADAEFAVVTDQAWPVDRSAEWFPLLANRRSVATVQGNEWIRGQFGRSLDLYSDLQLCADKSSTCIDEWRAEYGMHFDYIYIPKTAELQPGVVRHPDECCAALRMSLRADSRFDVVYDGEGATVFRVLA